LVHSKFDAPKLGGCLFRYRIGGRRPCPISAHTLAFRPVSRTLRIVRFGPFVTTEPFGFSVTRGGGTVGFRVDRARSSTPRHSVFGRVSRDHCCHYCCNRPTAIVVTCAVTGRAVLFSLSLSLVPALSLSLSLSPARSLSSYSPFRIRVFT